MPTKKVVRGELHLGCARAKVAPMLARIAAVEADRLQVLALDVDENPITTSRYRVMGMPTLALFVGGELVVQFMGAKPRAAIIAQLEPHLRSSVVGGVS